MLKLMKIIRRTRRKGRKNKTKEDRNKKEKKRYTRKLLPWSCTAAGQTCGEKIHVRTEQMLR